ncbi:hypothetical protein B0H17DRAFT_1139991 [Mycena rosella]|uniref:Uncharacterized protein n=1 Tax=Mycena rosella TaxID=1033263 RepID=A0AAD7D3H1_MYCRO|nr:hypothetical protein B0H17DRAFT_1139991 [Mycena rosella]
MLTTLRALSTNKIGRERIAVPILGFNSIEVCPSRPSRFWDLHVPKESYNYRPPSSGIENLPNVKLNAILPVATGSTSRTSTCPSPGRAIGRASLSGRIGIRWRPFFPLQTHAPGHVSSTAPYLYPPRITEAFSPALRDCRTKRLRRPVPRAVDAQMGPRRRSVRLVGRRRRGGHPAVYLRERFGSCYVTHGIRIKPKKHPESSNEVFFRALIVSALALATAGCRPLSAIRRTTTIMPSSLRGEETCIYPSTICTRRQLLLSRASDIPISTPTAHPTVFKSRSKAVRIEGFNRSGRVVEKLYWGVDSGTWYDLFASM